MSGDYDDLVDGLRRGRLRGTRLALGARRNPLQAVVQRAQDRLLEQAPLTTADLFEGFATFGYTPGGVYLPDDPDRAVAVQLRLADLGAIEDDFAREAAYRAYQAETGAWADAGEPGAWTWQQALARSEARFRVTKWGRRSGKTFHAAREAVARATKRPRSVIWVAAPSDEAVTRCFAMIARLLEDRGHRPDCPKWRDTDGDHLIELANGSVIHGISLGGDLAAAGTGVDYLILDEAEYCSREDWSRRCEPTLADKLGRALIISSSQEDETWFNQLAEGLKEDPDPAWAVFEGPSWQNFYKFPQGRNSQALRDAERSTEDAAEFLAIYGAKPSAELGRIFYAYKAKVHLDSVPFDPRHEVVLTADPSGGVNEYGVLAFQDYGDRVDVIDEFYQSGVTAEEVMAELETRPWRANVAAIWLDQGSFPMEITRWQRGGWPALPILSDDPAHPGQTKPFKPTLDESVPLVNNLFRNPIRFRDYQLGVLALVLAEWGTDRLADLDKSQRRQVLIALEERLADAALNPLDVEALRDCAGVRIDREKCPNLATELKHYRKRKARAGAVDARITPRKVSDHLCDCFRYFAWTYKRHLLLPGQAASYLAVDVADGLGYAGTNWVEASRLLAGRAGGHALTPVSYLRSA